MHKILCFITDSEDQDYFKQFEKCLMRNGLDAQLSFADLAGIEDSYNVMNSILSYLIVDARDKALVEKLVKNKDFFKHTSLCSLVFVIDKTTDLSKLKEILSSQKMTKYLLNRDWEPELHVPAFTAFFAQKKSSATREELVGVAKKLNKLIATGTEQTEKIKKIHKRLIKLRSETIRPFLLTGRYSPGTNPGGEFYDIFKGEQELILLITAACSFQSSSSVMSFISELKMPKNGIEHVAGLKRSIMSHLQNITKADSLFEFFLLRIDLKNIQSEIYSHGNFVVVANRAINEKKNFIAFDKNKPEINFQFRREDKIVILSPGLQKNFKEKIIDGKDYLNFILSHMEEQTKDLLNETFFQLKRISTGDFSEYDATMVGLDVETNAILKID